MATPWPISTDIAPGDTFEWTPPPTDSGLIFPVFLYCSDPWQEGFAHYPIYLQKPYDVWHQAQFPFVEGETWPPANSAPDEDYNANGVPNIFEQLFGRNPRAPDATPGWVPSVTGGGTVMRYTFTRAATLPQGTVLTVECSPDLMPFSWNPVATKTENSAWTGAATVTETTLPDGRVEVHVDTPLSANCGFFRLHAAF
jgi:hypothetical protein